MRVAEFGLALSLCAVLLPSDAVAKAHLWRMTEFFSNESGTIQFIEFVETEGSEVEVQLLNKELSSNANFYLFPNNLSGNTAFKWFLLATEDFAALPGAPAPDFIMPDGFFDPTSDVIKYRFTIDIVTLNSVPTDGIHSVDRNGVVAVNSPTNFAGVTGEVNLNPVSSSSRGGRLAVMALVAIIAFAALRRRSAAAA